MKLSIDKYYFFQSLGPARPLGNGFEADLEHEKLRIQIVKAGVLRIAITRAGRFDPNPSSSLQHPFDEQAQVDFTLTQTEKEIVLATAEITLTATRSPFALKAVRTDGSVVFATALDSMTGRSFAYGELNNSFVVSRDHNMEDAYYGLGEKSGPFNRFGRDYTMWNTDVMNGGATAEFTRNRPTTDPRSDNLSTEFDPYYISIPLYYHHPAKAMEDPEGSSPMSGHFIDNPWRGTFNFTHPRLSQFVFTGGYYTEYVFAGPSMETILRDYTELTGRMTPPPVWAIGHHQCRWHDYTQEQVEQLARTYRDRDLPCDVIWLDIDYMDGFRVFTWDKKKFPDPTALISTLKEQGFRMITIIDPGVKFERGNPLYEEGVAKRLFCETTIGTPYVGKVWPGQTVFPDFSLPETREWWGRLNADHVQSGIAGIWNDMNEPATFDGDLEAMRFGHGHYDHARYHNEYAILMAMGTVEGLLEAQPGLRTFVLSRAGSPGIQRYAANWMGDNISSWEHLWMSVPMALGLGISGQPFVGADVGGFGKHCEGELLARWYQCAAFTPFFRNHNCTRQRDQYPWSFGKSLEDICANAIRERYRLLPYIYTSFMQSSETGVPIQRPLIFNHQNDKVTRDLNDQFFFGDHFLVAPVLKPGQTQRNVYLPAGDWRNWNDGSARTGARFYLESTPMENIPVFVRAGAVIPFWPEPPQSTQNYFPEDVGLCISIPIQDGETISELHEDDGLSFAHQQQRAYLRTRFHLTRSKNKLTLTATVSGDGFPEFKRQRFRLRFLGGLPVDTQQDQLINNVGSGFSLEFNL